MRRYFKTWDAAYARMIELIKGQHGQLWTISQTLNERWYIAPGYYRSETATEYSVSVFEPHAKAQKAI